MSETAPAPEARKTLSDPVTLEVPVQRGSEAIGEVRVRRPNAGEMRGLNLHDLLKLDVDAMMKVLPRVTVPSLTAAEVTALDPADLVALSSEIADFLVPAGMRPPA